MTPHEKASCSRLLASLFYPPDRELVQHIHQKTLVSFLERHIQPRSEANDLLEGFAVQGTAEEILRNLSDEYRRLFSDFGETSISLVESFYKPWTLDPHCSLSFASERGLLLGDPAMHLLAIYRQCDLEVSEEFKGTPDHIAMELEFLSYLYQWATDTEIKRFIEDHLDWIPLVKDEFRRCHTHPFYVSALGILDFFLNREKTRLEAERYGEKKIT